MDIITQLSIGEMCIALKYAKEIQKACNLGEMVFVVNGEIIHVHKSIEE